MSRVSYVLLFLFMLKAQAISNNGIASLPSLHADLLGQGWATDSQFAGALVVGQLTPGPNGLWIVSLGYIVAGPLGAFLALCAATIPPMLVLPIDALYRRFGSLPGVEGFVRGIGLAVIGVSPLVLAQVLQGSGFDDWTAVIAAVAFVMVLSRRVPNIVVVALGAVAGVLIYR
jgi:chromate transporter